MQGIDRTESKIRVGSKGVLESLVQLVQFLKTGPDLIRCASQVCAQR